MNSRQARLAVIRGGMTNPKEERAKHDHYCTPKCAVDALLAEVGFEGSILEPACGPHGFVIRCLRQAGYRVTGSDIQRIPAEFGRSNVDFIQEKFSRVDNVVTNPPYSLATEFLRKSASIARRKVALLTRLTWFEGPSRYRLLSEFKPELILVLSRRLPFQTADGTWKTQGASFSHAWLVWDFSKLTTKTEFRLHLNENKTIHPPS